MFEDEPSVCLFVLNYYYNLVINEQGVEDRIKNSTINLCFKLNLPE